MSIAYLSQKHLPYTHTTHILIHMHIETKVSCYFPCTFSLTWTWGNSYRLAKDNDQCKLLNQYSPQAFWTRSKWTVINNCCRAKISAMNQAQQQPPNPTGKCTLIFSKWRLYVFVISWILQEGHISVIWKKSNRLIIYDFMLQSISVLHARERDLNHYSNAQCSIGISCCSEVRLI